jgi:sugar lactone lactonase YvrE
MDAELVLDARARIGEGPVWNARDKTLDWVDITGQALHRFSPATGSDHVTAIGRDIGALAHRERGGYVLALYGGFAVTTEGSSDWAMLACVAPDVPDVRLNDGKCDRRGRFWAGTLAYSAERGRGVLYRLDADGAVTTILTDLSISNGMDWSADDKTMYFIDSFAGGVDAFDFDLDSGTIENRRQLFAVEWDEATLAGLTIADGMTVDAEGHLWVAIFGKGEVRRYTPEGQLEQTITLPVSGVTSCAFGGDDLRDLYITTAVDVAGNTDNQLGAGGLYRCRPGPKGRLSYQFAG